MRGFALATIAAACLLAGCGGGGSRGRSTPPRATAPAGAPAPAPAQPAPGEPLPRQPVELGNRLTEVGRALERSVDDWLAAGDPAHGAPPDAVTVEALYEQRAYRLLSRRPRLASLTLRRLPGSVRARARDAVAALRDLMLLTPPTRRRAFKTGPALPAGQLLDLYRRAERRFGVAWNVLAAVNLVESDFGRVRSSSSAGAQGPMQFLRSSWREYGMGGNVHDPRDAIPGAANFLRAAGAPRSYRRALYAYNPSPLYVNAVLRLARRMARPRRNYFVFYSWQVFMRMPAGDRRLTGP